MLFEKSVDFDGAADGEINASVDDNRDYEASAVAGAIARAVLFGAVDGRAEFGGVIGVEYGGMIGAVPGFGGDGPNDGVLCAVGGNGWRGAGIIEFSGGVGVEFQLAVCDGIVTQMIGFAREENVAVPVGHCAVSAAGHGEVLDDGVG